MRLVWDDEVADVRKWIGRCWMRKVGMWNELDDGLDRSGRCW